MTRVGFYLYGDVPAGGAGERFPFLGRLSSRRDEIDVSFDVWRSIVRRADSEGLRRPRLVRRPIFGFSDALEGAVIAASSVIWSEVRSRTEKPDTTY